MSYRLVASQLKLVPGFLAKHARFDGSYRAETVKARSWILCN